ncbi:MAG: hypothetical protein SPH94_00720 [Fusobacterium necrophorum]|nr:hypothetical protein [Fusobacterium necrophorum]
MLIGRGSILESFIEGAHEKSTIEWIMERYGITKNKDSSIVNNRNLCCYEYSNPKYILNLLLSIITLSLKTNELVKSLPKVEF